jgi:glyoxylase-like metal-dependent hydrolase (beta-lactamase superfamily II)
LHTIDLLFQNVPGAIAVYLVPHRNGAALVECGPGSSLPALQASLHALGYAVGDITDVLLTHIHLDHGGAAGWFARQGARIHVHPNGATHLVNPEKLLASAARIYGDKMNALWGEFLPVPEDRICIHQDNERIEIDGCVFRAIDTPGHASHHFAYRMDEYLFSGDIGGVRLDGLRYLRLPMPPPDFNLEQWRKSLARIGQEYDSGGFKSIVPTHFGVYHDPAWHLKAVGEALDEIESWILRYLPSQPSIEELRQVYTAWNTTNLQSRGFNPVSLRAHEAANPAFMSADGIQRYWRKYREEPRAQA